MNGEQAERLTAALINGPWATRPMQLRLGAVLGTMAVPIGLAELVAELLARFPSRPARDTLIAFLRAQPEVSLAAAARPEPPQEVGVRLHRPMVPLATEADLLRLLWLDAEELSWFADRQNRSARASSAQLVHYRYRAQPTRDSVRLLEIPKARLKEIQRRLREQIVTRIPLHSAAHGGVPGRSVRTCLEPHVGRGVVIRCDLEGFFAGVSRPRVQGLLEAVGLDPAASATVAGLCTTVVPRSVREELLNPAQLAGRGAAAQARLWRYRRRLAVPHLAQGAPTSPGLANAIAFSLDHRLTSLATRFGLKYTRYVDDLILSGPAQTPVELILAAVRQIVRDEDFRLAERKTVILREGRRQQLLGAVVNRHPAVRRAERDQLKAILHNCARHGVESQLRGEPPEAFRQRLRGQIAWIASMDERQGAALLARYDQVEWR
ncbi:MAG: hypothetical protein JWO63_1254 [Frankiales bacterium]|nr:hypothetical protein [Frankiales bacterium]